MTNETLTSFSRSTGAKTAFWKTDAFNRFLREPLVHFLVLGALLFVANAVFAPGVPKERLIEFTPEIRKSIIDTFTQTQKHAPSADELKRLTEDWLLNEIVYREALAQGFDKGDDMIRDRINQKMRLLIFSNIEPGTPQEADLQKWLDAHRGQYDIPERLSFFDLPMGSQADAETTLKLIDAGKEPESVRLLARSFTDRPSDTLVAAFNKQFVADLKQQPLHKWQILQSAGAWHIVRVDGVIPKQTATVATVGNTLTEDWQQDDLRKKAASAVRAMAKPYVIRGAELP